MAIRIRTRLLLFPPERHPGSKRRLWLPQRLNSNARTLHTDGALAPRPLVRVQARRPLLGHEPLRSPS